MQFQYRFVVVKYNFIGLFIQAKSRPFPLQQAPPTPGQSHAQIPAFLGLALCHRCFLIL